MTSLLAAAGATTIVFDAGVVNWPLVNVSAVVSAVRSAMLLNRATPPDRVRVVVPWSGPVPRASIAVTWVVLSSVSML